MGWKRFSLLAVIGFSLYAVLSQYQLLVQKVSDVDTKNKKGSNYDDLPENLTESLEDAVVPLKETAVVTASCQPTSSPSKSRHEDGLRLCRIRIDPGQRIPTKINLPIGVQFQCVGPDYEEFSEKLLELASNPGKYGKDPVNWGRRNTPIPPNSSALIMGNSHTRQVFAALMCQFGNEIINATQIRKIDERGNGAWAVNLRQNIFIYGVFNSPLVYSPRWAELLPEYLFIRSLDSLDVIVLGNFNAYHESANTTFLLLMKNLTAGTDADFERGSSPEVDDLANIYSGPILTVGMFNQHSESQFNTTVYKIKSLEKHGRRNIVAINARQYVSYIGECATDGVETIGTCINPKLRRNPHHRCMGENGGHTDLVAWDIAEEIRNLLVRENQKTWVG